MSCDVRVVRNRALMRAFLQVPFIVRAGDPLYVPPLTAELLRTLNVRRNPYFRSASLRLYVCFRDEAPVARVAVIISRAHEAKFGFRTAFFGFFECLNDAAVAKSLFDEVDRYCEQEGVKLLEGPISPNHYSEVGLQLSGFDSMPAFFQPSNPVYYSDLLESAGFRVAEKMFTARNPNVSTLLQGKSQKAPVSVPAAPDEWTVRPLRLSEYRLELERIREVFNDAFADNWHFLPLSREEYRWCTKSLRQITNPEHVRIVEYRSEPVGVLMCVLDINPLLQPMRGRAGLIGYLRFRRGRQHVRNLIVYAVGIKRKFQSTRAFLLLLNEAREMISRFDSVETTWMMPHNSLAGRAAKRLGMTADKQFAIYAKQMTS